MDTRSLGYLGLGALVAIVFVTLLGVPPAVWITVAIIAGVVGVAYAVYKARADGTDIAARVVARQAEPVDADPPSPAPQTNAPAPTATVASSPVEVELVRAADDAAGVPAVWLHRFGGRRVHRLKGSDGWVVEQVSTKDPDNPKKRVIGESLTFALEADAMAAADGLAHGVRPNEGMPAPKVRPSLTAEATA